MALMQTGRNLFAKFTTTEDSSGERFGSTGAYIHVGSSTAAVDTGHNSMQSTGAAVKALDSGYPKRNDGTESTGPNILVYRSTFTTSEAVFQWEEIGVKNTTATSTGTGTLMNRALSSLGTKPNTQSWQVTVKNTVST